MNSYVVPSDHAFAIPDEVSDEAAALIEPLSVALWAIRRSGLRARESVLIVGAGPIGVLCALVAAAKKAGSVVISDPDERRRQRAADLTGATACSPADVDAGHSEHVDVVLECSGSAGGLHTALTSAGEGGRIVVVGVGVQRLDMPMQTIQEGEVMITGSHRYRDTWPEAIGLVAGGQIPVDPIVTSSFTLEQVGEAILAPQRIPGSMKVCIDVARGRANCS